MEDKYIFKMEFTKENVSTSKRINVNSVYDPYLEIENGNIRITVLQSELEDHIVKANHSDATLADTAALMTSSDYKDRFLAEYIQLKTRMIKLAKMFDDWKKDNLSFTPTCPMCTYRFQLRAMEDYIGILTMRAKMEGIELPE